MNNLKPIASFSIDAKPSGSTAAPPAPPTGKALNAPVVAVFTKSTDGVLGAATVNTATGVVAVTDPRTGNVPVDPTVAAFRRKGAMLSNLVQYVSYMDGNPEGIGDPNARVTAGIAHGYFEGAKSSKISGGLSYAGFDFSWTQLKAGK